MKALNDFKELGMQYQLSLSAKWPRVTISDHFKAQWNVTNSNFKKLAIILLFSMMLYKLE